MSKRNALGILFALILLVCTLGPMGRSSHAAGSRYFPETGKTVNDPFLSYWTTHGGLSQQGYPITDAYNERNDADGKTYLTQYFERARFESHPENKDPKFQVLLGLLGKEALAAKYGDSAPAEPAQTVPGGGSKTFSETGKTVTGLFLNYWNTHGGLEQQGFPITDAYEEVNDADGQTYITQYFERARFEYHPESSDPKFKVLLGLVGREIYGLKQAGGGGGSGGSGGNPTPTPAPAPAPITVQNTLIVPGWTHVVVTTNNIVIFYNADKGGAAFARLNSDGSLTVLQKYPYPSTGGGPDFSPGISIIASGPANQVLFYRASAGAASVCRMSDDGVLVGGCSNFSFEKYWTDIAIDKVTGLMRIYSRTDGVSNYAKLNSNSSITNISSATNIIKATRLVLPIGNRMWISYDTNTKNCVTFTVNESTGETKLLQTVPDLGGTWTLIASNQSTIGFYDSTHQFSLIASTALDGSIVKLRTYAAPSGITTIASALNGPYLNYWGATGELTVVKITSDGTATNLQEYKP